jgi:hypothetical protein
MARLSKLTMLLTFLLVACTGYEFLTLTTEEPVEIEATQT